MALALVSLVAAGATGILCLFRSTCFRPYFGTINPLLAVALIIVLGTACLRLLHSRGWFEIYTRATPAGVILSTALASLFAVSAILADCVIRFPQDMNVPPPWSVLFYPAMAYVAEILFHVLPLALLLIWLRTIFKRVNPHTLVWSCILLVSCIEPVFQVPARTPETAPSWAGVYVALHVFAFNLLQLCVFRRYDFVSMYSFRIVYYLNWHIIWGYLRLQLLF
jgi:hypothetical protein